MFCAGEGLGRRQALCGSGAGTEQNSTVYCTINGTVPTVPYSTKGVQYCEWKVVWKRGGENWRKEVATGRRDDLADSVWVKQGGGTVPRKNFRVTGTLRYRTVLYCNVAAGKSSGKSSGK